MPAWLYGVLATAAVLGLTWLIATLQKWRHRAKIAEQATLQLQKDFTAIEQRVAKAISDLPALHGPPKTGAIFGLTEQPKTCMSCRHFELEGAQQAMQRNPAFMRVMLAISPYEHGRRIEYEEEPCPECSPDSNEACPVCCGQRKILKPQNVYPPNISPAAKWSEYGWCLNSNMRFEGSDDATKNIIWGKQDPPVCGGKLYQIRLGVA